MKSLSAALAAVFAILLTALPSPAASVTLVPRGATWKYLDNGTNQGTAWKEPAFDDAAWASGPAVLGGGDTHVVTTVNIGPSGGRYITTYFRRTFTVANPATVSALAITLLRDDGAVIFLNGVEIARDNIPAGAYNYLTNAPVIVSGTDETTYFPLTPTSLPLVAGVNVLAVEVHQRDNTSSDLGFDLDLIATVSNPNNDAPTVSLIAPLATDDFDAPSTIDLEATASDTDGTVTKVEFFNGAAKLGQDLTSPYEFSWTGVITGTYTLTAKATDSEGAVTTSAPVSISVTNIDNASPTVALTAPLNGATITSAIISLEAGAGDTDGVVTKVEFFQGTTKVGEDTVSPYAVSWSGVAPGTYAVTAVARDNDGGTTTSSTANITVNAAPSLAYTQNFNGLGTATTLGGAATTTVGWTVLGGLGGSNTSWVTSIPVTGAPSAVTGGTANTTLIASTTIPASTASSNTTGYNFALAASPTDRALGSSPTSGAGIVLQLTLSNTTAAGITALNIGYDIRRFTVVSTANELPGYRLFYSLDSGASWTNVAALNPAVTGAAVNVPNSVGVTTVAATAVTLSSVWSAGSSIRFRWIDDNADQTSPDQIVGLDNVAITATQFASGTPPTVALTAPANNAVFNAPATVNLSAGASDNDGSIIKVEFYQGATKLGEDTTGPAPYTFAWTGVAAGTYALTARAFDNDSNSTTSAPVSITVNPAPGSGSITRGPYLNSPNHNSIFVRWRTTQSTIGRVRYGTSPSLLDQTTDEITAATNHVVKLTGLTPYTRYYYSVGSAFDTLTPQAAETTSFSPGAPVPTAADYTFRTAPTPGTATPTRIWIVGDCGRGTQIQANGREAYYSFMGSRVPDLNLQLGDNAYNSGTDTEYQSGYWNMYHNIFRKMPQWSTLGNHDADNGSTSSTANFPYFDMFTFPTAGECGGVASGTERYYSFDYGNIHFICLDSQTSSRNTIEANGSDGPMAAWLRQDLASVTATWIVAFFHHPIYSKGSHNSDTESQMVQMRTNFGPILETGGVDLIFVGHSHNYERSFLMDGHYGTSGTITNAMRRNAGNGSTTGITTGGSGVIRRAPNFTAVNTTNGAVIPADGAYIKPLTGPRDHFGTVYNTAGMSGLADSGSINHTAMYLSYNTVGTVNLDVDGNTLTATYVQSGGARPDNFTIIKQGAADTDGDGLSDEYEIANGLNRRSAADASLDSDGDGLTNLQEAQAGTAANNAADKPRVATLTAQTDGSIVLQIATVSGKTYRVEANNAFPSGTWTTVATGIIGTGGLVPVPDPGAAGIPNRIYRVTVLP